MPNYDIIPLAVDLLDYTIQRVKTKEPEYRKIKALVQENGQLAERELFEKIRDDGKPHFPKSQTFHLCARLEECATTILEKCISADGRYFETDFEDRLKDLDAVLVACDTMLQHINLSFKKKYITGDQCHYWAELVRPVRQKAFSWRRNVGDRAAALREAERAQELAKIEPDGTADCWGYGGTFINGYTGHEPLYWGVTCLYLSSPHTLNTNSAYYLNTDGNVNSNYCNNTNGSRPALMVRSDRVGPKPKAAPSIASKEVTSRLGASKTNTLR